VGVVDERAADERPDGGGDAPEARPGADRLRPVGRDEGALDHRQAARGQQRPAHALQHAGDDQRLRVGRDAAQQGGEGEPRRADHEDPPPAEAVAQRAAEQDQAGQGEQVAVGDPLELGERRVEVLADGLQGDVDDRAVEEGHARAESGRGDDCSSGRRTESDVGDLGIPIHVQEIMLPPWLVG
jgi:hypothetical protein